MISNVRPTAQNLPANVVETVAPSQSPSPAHTATPASTGPASHDENVAAIRLLVKAYWEAFNEYDPDRALQMLEEGYRALEDELIRGDIGRMKLFRVTLDVSEESPPTLKADGDYITSVSLETPIGTRQAKMVFRHIDGQWWIVFSDEVE